MRNGRPLRKIFAPIARIAVAEQLLADVIAQHRHALGAGFIGVRQEAAPIDGMVRILEYNGSTPFTVNVPLL